MLPKQNRLTTKEFDTVFKNSVKLHGTLLTLLVAKDAGEVKIGVSVTKKGLQNIVKRNLLRRRLYAIAKENPPSRSSILILKKEGAGASYAALAEEYKTLLTKANYIK